MSVTKRARFDVFKRDDFTCQYCNRKPPQVTLEIDHVIPVSAGGSDSDTNLITACFDCNRGKSSNGLDAIPETIQHRIAVQRELAEQVEALNQFVIESRAKEEATVSALGRYWCNECGGGRKDKWTWGDARKRSARIFLKRLDLGRVYEAIDIAIAKIRPLDYKHDEKAWRYFCGVCWKMIKDLSETGGEF